MKVRLEMSSEPEGDEKQIGEVLVVKRLKSTPI
jgi:hypothetical protein